MSGITSYANVMKNAMHMHKGGGPGCSAPAHLCYAHLKAHSVTSEQSYCLFTLQELDLQLIKKRGSRGQGGTDGSFYSGK